MAWEYRYLLEYREGGEWHRHYWQKWGGDFFDAGQGRPVGNGILANKPSVDAVRLIEAEHGDGPYRTTGRVLERERDGEWVEVTRT